MVVDKGREVNLLLAVQHRFGKVAVDVVFFQLNGELNIRLDFVKSALVVDDFGFLLPDLFRQLLVRNTFKTILDEFIYRHSPCAQITECAPTGVARVLLALENASVDSSKD